MHLPTARVPGGEAVTLGLPTLSRAGRTYGVRLHQDLRAQSLFQRASVLIAALAAVGAAALQATGILGLTPAEFAASGAGTVRAASYAFAIWGVIYAGLLVYAVYQLVPGWASEAALKHFGWPSVVSATGWALGGLAAAIAVTLGVLVRGHVVAYPVPVIWGLVAVFVAERGSRPEAAWFALAGAALVAAVWLRQAWGRPRSFLSGQQPGRLSR